MKRETFNFFRLAKFGTFSIEFVNEQTIQDYRAKRTWYKCLKDRWLLVILNYSQVAWHQKTLRNQTKRKTTLSWIFCCRFPATCQNNWLVAFWSTQSWLYSYSPTKTSNESCDYDDTWDSSHHSLSSQKLEKFMESSKTHRYHYSMFKGTTLRQLNGKL